MPWQNRAPIVKRRRPPSALRTDTLPYARGAPLAVDAEGRVPAATQIASPNADDRPNGTAISMLVVHGISLPPARFGGDSIERLFTNRLDPTAHPSFATIASLRVSAHFLIRRNGALVQFVPCARRAWHAGESSWQGRTRCNDFSIGVELEGTDSRSYTAAQYVMLARLARGIRGRYPITDIVGHSDIAPGRKSDPGAAFDWRRFARRIGCHLPGRLDTPRRILAAA
jgi:N-acetyl-anhydromuramoyl-L-alanine amidase